MICDQCNRESELIVNCDCFTVFCANCFSDHECPGKHLAQTDSSFTPTRERAPEPKQIEGSAGVFNLRPYQRQAIEAVIEELT